MKSKLILSALLFTACAMPAGDAPGLYMWKASELKAFTKSLSPKINDKKVATENLAAFGNYSFLMAHREGSGEAEYHANQADIMMIESGEATLVLGGTMVDAKTTAPNEMRGPSINGGSERKVAAGDVITIPAKMPHMMKLPSGKEITYFVVKVTQ
jgi:mannose-6-phosphate isomerase-like protein (cupin superfamily)